MMSAEDFMLPCLNKKIFGVECFGCGSQRAFLMVFEGKFSEAFQMWPAVYTVMIFLIIAGLSFVDKKRNYNSLMVGLAIFNAIIIVTSYFYKHFGH